MPQNWITPSYSEIDRWHIENLRFIGKTILQNTYEDIFPDNKKKKEEINTLISHLERIHYCELVDEVKIGYLSIKPETDYQKDIFGIEMTYEEAKSQIIIKLKEYGVDVGKNRDTENKSYGEGLIDRIINGNDDIPF